MNFTSPLVAAEVRAEMARQRVSVLRMAIETKIPSSRLHRRLNGSTPFDSDELALISAHLGVPASELIRRAEAAA